MLKNKEIQVVLGWKLVRLLIELNKRRFFHRVNSPDFAGSSLVKSCFEWNMRNPHTLYYTNLISVLCKYAATPLILKGVTPKQLHQYHEQKVITDIQELVTLKLMPLPRKWWKIQSHVEESRWSRTLIKFRCINAGLGNRDSYRTADSISQDGGRVLQCPMCFLGDNNEFHQLVSCKQMKKHRQSIGLRTGQTLQSFITEQRASGHDDLQAVRILLGQEAQIK